jgi:hypothetical protein
MAYQYQIRTYQGQAGLDPDVAESDQGIPLTKTASGYDQNRTLLYQCMS